MLFFCISFKFNLFTRHGRMQTPPHNLNKSSVTKQQQLNVAGFVETEHETQPPSLQNAGHTSSTSTSTSSSASSTSSTPRVRIWLELGGPDGSGSVVVGQATTLTVRAVVPGTMGLKIVDCAALDGLGESTQQLLDERGCPIDEQVSFPLSVFLAFTAPKMIQFEDDSKTIL